MRSAGQDDAAELARLSTELGYPVEPAEMESRLAAALGDPDQRVTVAVAADGSLAGWIHVEKRGSLMGGPLVEIQGLVVDARERRRGVGKALVDWAKSWTLELGLVTIRVRSNVVRAESHPFYEARGYARDKTQHVYTRRLA